MHAAIRSRIPAGVAAPPAPAEALGSHGWQRPGNSGACQQQDWLRGSWHHGVLATPTLATGWCCRSMCRQAWSVGPRLRHVPLPHLPTHPHTQGYAMATNLLKAGYSLTVWNRSMQKCDDLAAGGAAVANTPAEVQCAGSC